MGEEGRLEEKTTREGNTWESYGKVPWECCGKVKGICFGSGDLEL